MLQFFKDANLTLPIVALTPKWVSIPTKGGSKTATIYLGDAYTSIVAQPVGASDTTITLTNIDEFPQTGVVTIDIEQIHYTGVSATPPQLTGCTRGYNSTIATTHLVGAIAYPQNTFSSSGNISILIGGMTAGPNGLSLAPVGGSFGPPGVPLLLPISTIYSGVAGAYALQIKITAPAGTEQQYDNLALSTTPITRPGDNNSGFSTITVQPTCPIYVQQRDQGLAQRLRLLPASRQVSANLPGFTWGQYRWRDNTTENAQAIVPTRWDIDTSLITQDFIGGVGSIGETNDLEPIDLEEQNSSIFLRAQHGQYFTGVNRYFYPSDNFNLEFLPCYPGLPFTYQLQMPPREQTPVFVGRWALDSQGFYEYNVNARYTIPSTFNASSSQPQFMVDRKTGILTVNAACQIPQTTILLGVLSGGVQEYFDMPYYPLAQITNLYVGDPFVVISNFTYDETQGNLTFPKAPGTSQGQPIFAVVNAAIAVLYEYDVDDTTSVQNTNIPDEQIPTKDTRLLTPDLNPAFSGLSSGHVYLQHRVLKPVSVTLSADKPEIPIPPTLSSIIGLIAYGPIYYNGDYALLTATAIGSLPGEVVPGATLQVVPGGYNPLTGLPEQNYSFRGLINGLDPNTNTIQVVTGGDGIANLVYTPEPNFGFYIPTTAPWVTPSTTATPTAATFASGVASLTFSSLTTKFQVNSSIRLAGFTPSSWNGDWQITGVNTTTNVVQFESTTTLGTVTAMGTVGALDTLTLPSPLPISQLWDTEEGWLTFLYAVLSNDPLFGVSNYSLTGHASIASGTATVQVTNIPGLTINPGSGITIAGATSSVIDGTWNPILTAALASGVWTLTFAAPGSLTSTAQTAGTMQITGSLPFVTDGTVDGAVTITHSSWLGGVATFTLASNPTNLEVGQNVSITGCTTSGLNGFQNVLSVYETSGTWYFTAPTNAVGTGSETESGATLTYSNFRTNGVLANWGSISVVEAYDKNGNNYTSGSFNGNVVQLVFSAGIYNPSQGFVQAYLFQFLEREIIQVQVVGTNIYSNSIMLQMQSPNQLLNNPYLVLSTDETTTPPYYPNADSTSRMNVNRLGITP